MKLEIGIKELEKEYFNNFNTWKIEQYILYSFPKNDLLKFIKNTEKSYLKNRLFYINNFLKIKKSTDYIVLGKIDKYFIERLNYYFNGGEELDINKSFLNKLKTFYKLNYTNKNLKTYKRFNIESLGITEVLSNYMKIPNNLNKNLKCPLHNEKTGSFRVYKKTNSFYCFGCHKGGNVINFISEIESISTKKAYKKLINLYSNN